jgi:hypothetical protein
VLPKGKSYAHVAYHPQSFDEFWAGDALGGTPGGEEITRQQFRFSADFGLGNSWGAVLSLGYFDTSAAVVGPFTIGKQDGLADTYAGLRYLVTNAEALGFDSTLRRGVTLPGDYTTGNLSAPGMMPLASI